MWGKAHGEGGGGKSLSPWKLKIKQKWKKCYRKLFRLAGKLILQKWWKNDKRGKYWGNINTLKKFLHHMYGYWECGEGFNICKYKDYNHKHKKNRQQRNLHDYKASLFYLQWENIRPILETAMHLLTATYHFKNYSRYSLKFNQVVKEKNLQLDVRQCFRM